MITFVEWVPISEYKGFPETVMIATDADTPVVAFQTDTSKDWYLNPTGMIVDWFEPTHWALVPEGPNGANEEM